MFKFAERGNVAERTGAMVAAVLEVGAAERAAARQASRERWLREEVESDAFRAERARARGY